LIDEAEETRPEAGQTGVVTAFRHVPLTAGLYLCAVPIGNARDVTLRTLDILASADVIAAEDTRTARKLMEIHGISIGDRPMALTVSGLPSDAFHFAGFLPSTTAARCRALENLRDVQATVVLYESPRRVSGLLTDLVQVSGGARQVVICRELTKKFEEVMRGTADQLLQGLDGRNLKGEVVVLIARGIPEQMNEDDVIEALKSALKTMRVKDAATAVAGASGMARREVYQLALNLKEDSA